MLQEKKKQIKLMKLNSNPDSCNKTLTKTFQMEFGTLNY